MSNPENISEGNSPAQLEKKPSAFKVFCSIIGALAVLVGLFVGCGYICEEARLDGATSTNPGFLVGFWISEMIHGKDPEVLQRRKRLKEIQKLHKNAEQGDAKAQYDLGRFFLYRQGEDLLLTTQLHIDGDAEVWLRRSAQQGFVEAQYLLGCCYLKDFGLPTVASLFPVQPAAPSPYSVSRVQLSRPIPINEKEGLYWLGLAAEQGDEKAKEILKRRAP